jgi:hypothetical protein
MRGFRHPVRLDHRYAEYAPNSAITVARSADDEDRMNRSR